MKNAVILVLYLSACGVCFAQEPHVSFLAGVIGLRNSGTISSVYPQVGVEFSTHIHQKERMDVVSRTRFYPYRKVLTGDGYRFSELALVRAYSGKYFFVEPGTYLTHYRTSLWTKTAVYPSLGFGLNYQDIIVSEVIFNLRDPISINHGSGVMFNCQAYIPLTQDKKWGLQTEMEIRFLRFQQVPVGSINSYDTNVTVGLYYRF